jgi:hypothetical protein
MNLDLDALAAAAHAARAHLRDHLERSGHAYASDAVSARLDSTVATAIETYLREVAKKAAA